MSRRGFLTGTGIALSVPLVGCLSTGIDAGEGASNETATENEDDESPSDAALIDEEEGSDRSACSFNVELVEDPPEDVSIVSAEEEDLMDIDIIERIFEEADDSEKHRGTVTRPSGEYEQFSIMPKSTDAFEEAKTALEPYPRYENSDYPYGVYVTRDTGKIVVAIVDLCQW